MNKALDRLFEITKKTECQIIGLMSGTSLDGLDIVLCTVSINAIRQTNFKSVQYPVDISNKLLKTRSKELVSLADISYLNTKMAHFFADEVNTALNEWGIEKAEIDLIASHGQTIYHDSESSLKNTFQIVDGDHIAQITDIITISDVRQKHVSAGGEGAPLAVYLDEFLFQDERKTRVALNLGGIANLTVISPSSIDVENISTDVGPANTLMNEAMLLYFGQAFDDEGKIAAKGSSHSGLVKYLLLDPFFRKPFPKSTGQELFNLKWVQNLMESHGIQLEPEDLVATLTEFTIKSVVRALDDLVGERPYDIVASGGGIKNKTLIEGLKRNLTNADFKPIENFGISADAKEGVLMALIGYNLLRKEGVKIASNNIHLGKISLPD